MNEIFNRMVQENITPNTCYVLHCIKENLIPSSFVNKELELVKLKTNGWLNDDLSLTSKSLIFMGEINGFFKKSKKKTSKDLMGGDFIDKIKEYVQIFPNKKLSSGKYARVDAKNLETAFRWFFENYDYEWDIILKATERYVDEYSIRNYEYMRTAQYFIRKQNIDKSFESELATYCQYINENPDDEGAVYFKENVV
jgi:hypothetical protein